MYLCPKDAKVFAHFDELFLFCVDQTIGPFTNTVWIDTRVIEKWKRVENQAYPLRPMVQFWWFQCVIWERSKHCIHMKRHLLPKQLNNVSAAFLWKQIVTLRWPWNLTFSLYRSMHQNWQKCFKNLMFQTKYTLMGWPWPSMVMVST